MLTPGERKRSKNPRHAQPEHQGAYLNSAVQTEPNTAVITKNSNLAAVKVEIVVELASCRMKISDILKLRIDQIVELETPYEQPAIVKVNGRPYAHAEIIAIDERYGVRLTEILPA